MANKIEDPHQLNRELMELKAYLGILATTPDPKGPLLPPNPNPKERIFQMAPDLSEQAYTKHSNPSKQLLSTLSALDESVLLLMRDMSRDTQDPEQVVSSIEALRNGKDDKVLAGKLNGYIGRLPVLNTWLDKRLKEAKTPPPPTKPKGFSR